ncbi:MAG: hypothetical protein ABI222_14720 [Opitutaceae bacterium]
MTLLARHLVIAACLSLGLATRGGTPLAEKSPFQPPEGTTAGGAGENTPLELRGIIADESGYRFSIFDPAKKSGQWVRLNEPGRDFTVRSHDVDHDAVTLDYQGRTLTLSLHTAKITGAPMPEMSAGPGPRPVGGTPGFGPMPKPPTPDETARYQRAVEEINRRRAARDRGPMPVPIPRPK